MTEKHRSLFHNLFSIPLIVTQVLLLVVWKKRYETSACAEKTLFFYSQQSKRATYMKPSLLILCLTYSYHVLSYSSKIFCIIINPEVNKNKRKELWYIGVANHNKQELVHDHAFLYPILAKSQASDY